MNESVIVAVLRLLIEQDQSYKFIIGLVTFFIIPQFINIINASIAKRAATKLTNKINTTLNDQNQYLKIIKDRVDLIFNDNFEESTLDQIEAIFRGRVGIDVELLVKNTRQVIIINHIENKEATLKKVNKFCTTICGNTQIVLNKFKRNGEPCGSFLDTNEWINSTSGVVLEFIYNCASAENRDACYNYDSLRYQLKGQFDTFILNFINKIDKY